MHRENEISKQKQMPKHKRCLNKNLSCLLFFLCVWYSMKQREKKHTHEFKTIHTSVNGTQNCAIYASKQSDKSLCRRFFLNCSFSKRHHGGKNVCDDKWLEFHLKLSPPLFIVLPQRVSALAIAFRLVQFVYYFWFEVGFFFCLSLSLFAFCWLLNERYFYYCTTST